jgi:hypothetical protein
VLRNKKPAKSGVDIGNAYYTGYQDRSEIYFFFLRGKYHMKRKAFPIVLMLAVVALLAVLAGPASAVSVTGLSIDFSCDRMHVSDPYTIVYNRDNTGSGREAVTIEVRDGMGKLLHYEAGSEPLGTVHIPGGFNISYSATPEWNPIVLRWYSDAGNGLPRQIARELGGKCEGLPWAPSQEVPVPPGFEQREITCDVPVYDQPAGSPVGDNRVTAGQHWNVNLTPVAGPDGRNWTEIFVAGPNTGFIPTACVR